LRHQHEPAGKDQAGGHQNTTPAQAVDGCAGHRPGGGRDNESPRKQAKNKCAAQAQLGGHGRGEQGG